MKEKLEFAKQAEERASDQVGVIHSLVFDNKNEGRLGFMNRLRYTCEGYGISVYRRDEQD